jgi:hypothetical protein
MARNTSDGEEVASDEETLEEAVEKQDWINLVNEEVLFTCLVKARGKKCSYGPFKYRFHLNDHMRKVHLMILPKFKPGPKKEKKKDTRVVNAKAMNFKVMTNSFKRARKEFWKKSKQWERRAIVTWEKLEAKTKEVQCVGTCPPLLTLIQKSQKLEELLGIVSLGKGVIDVGKFEKLHNSQVLATLILQYPTSTKRITKVMRSSFSSIHWEANERTRKQMVEPILDWHRAKSFANM